MLQNLNDKLSSNEGVKKRELEHNELCWGLPERYVKGKRRKFDWIERSKEGKKGDAKNVLVNILGRGRDRLLYFPRHYRQTNQNSYFL